MHSVTLDFGVWCWPSLKKVCIMLSRYWKKPLTVLFFFPPRKFLSQLSGADSWKSQLLGGGGGEKNSLCFPAITVRTRAGWGNFLIRPWVRNLLHTCSLQYLGFRVNFWNRCRLRTRGSYHCIFQRVMYIGSLELSWQPWVEQACRSQQTKLKLWFGVTGCQLDSRVLAYPLCCKP